MIEKVGRNDPCPCGSGRKYKKCCNDKVISIDSFVETKLNELQLHFMRWAMSEHKEEINAHLEPYYETMNIPGDARQTLQFFASLWYMTSVKRNGKTLLQDYLSEKVPEVKNARVREIVQTWDQAAPSVFIVKNWAPDGHVIVEDVFTKESRWVKLLEDHHRSREYGLGIGTVLPAETGYIFFTTFFYVPASLQETEQAATELYNAFEQASVENPADFMSISFMDVLQFFMFGTEFGTELSEKAHSIEEIIEAKEEKPSLETETPETEKVTETVVNSLTAGQLEVLDAYTAYVGGREAEAELLEVGTRLWIAYCERAKPILRKPQVAAAALYYLLDEMLLDGKVTQVQLAKDFTVSSTSISSRYKDLSAVLEVELSGQAVEEVAATVR